MVDKMETKRGHLGGSVEHSEGKCGKSVVAILRFICGSPCLCRLRTEGLIPVSKYWTYRSHSGVYGLSKPTSWLPTEGWLFPTTSMVGSGEKLDTDPWITQSGWGLCRKPFFLGAVDLFKYVGDCAKGCHVRRLSTGSVHGAYGDWRGKRTCHVDYVFPCKMYIDLNRCDSRIWVTACSWLPSSRNLLD
jgi:hypothetical protein